MSWKQELESRLKTQESLEKLFPLTADEREFFNVSEFDGSCFGFLSTRHFAALAEPATDDPIRRQFVPTAQEFVFRSYELADPLGEEMHKTATRLIHRYHDRALLLVNDECAVHCRYCFRRSFAMSGKGVLAGRELRAAASYLAKHREIKDLLLSGGDPLVLDDRPLFRVMDEVKKARPDLVVRIGTRVPGALPSRVTRGLVRGLRARSPVWIVAHFNHPRELSEAASVAIGRLVDSGIPVLSQSVLLRGVNDSPDVLDALFRGLVGLRVKPYYLFQGDLAAGTSHLRVPLERGLAIMKELRLRLSSVAMPIYAVDLPGGGGKVPLTESYFEGDDEDSWRFRSIEGRPYRYPKEK